MKYVGSGNACQETQESGAKGSALAKLAAAGFNVPAWFVVKPSAFRDSLSTSQIKDFDALCGQELLDENCLSRLAALVADVSTVEQVNNEIDTALRALAAATTDEIDQFFAVRSSAFDEDGQKHSFAGQLETYLYVKAEDVPARVVDVWQSAFSARIVAYRTEHGLPALPAIPCVLVQKMVAADVSGVAMSADPLTGGAERTVVGAVYGLGHGLVSGELDADTYFVCGNDIDRNIARKHFAYRLAEGGGIALKAVDELSARKAALKDEQIQAVSALAKACELHFGTPQDIEWAYAADQLHLLQSRPITALAAPQAPRGELRIFDNSNIGESYNGVTTPLTFTFARKAYKNVYLQFCRILMVPEKTLAANEDVFANMIALIRGRIYYNLINWYRVLAMLPGYAFNSRFMEQMMGVKEGLPEEIRVNQPATTSWRQAVDAMCLVGSMIGLICAFASLKSSIEKFYARLADALRPVDLTALSIEELVAYYRSLETRLLLKWDAPLVNDFFAMIFYGVLGSLTRQTLGDTSSTTQNDLLAETGDIISAEPARRIAQMAKLAAADASLVDVLCNKPLQVVQRRIDREPQFAKLYSSYIEKFGDRCIGELKLESATLLDEPLPLLRSVGQMAKRLNAGGRIGRRQGRLVRRRAEKKLFTTLAHQPVKRALFAWVLSNARETIRNRENLRFERTRVFGRVRQIFLELGRRLHWQHIIDDARDIFYLELEEILGFVDGTSTTLSLRDLIQLRKQEFLRYQSESDPPNRIEMRGAAGLEMSARQLPEAMRNNGNPGALLHGIGCCPGVVRGPVRVVLDPRDAELRDGEILVAKRTDPGWITLFPAAAGLLVEHGSLLSHSAIVSRELGLPAVVSVAGLCAALETGDVVEFDGSTGSIVIICKRSVDQLCAVDG